MSVALADLQPSTSHVFRMGQFRPYGTKLDAAAEQFGLGHDALPGYAGGSALGLSATDAHGQSLGR